MSDLGFNKIAFCVLGTGLALIGLNEASHALFKHTEHEKPGYFVEVAAAAGPATDAPVEGPRDYGLLLASGLLLTLWTAGHALLNKQSAAAAWGWIVTCLLLPFVGPALYALFGINRVLTRARRRQPAAPRTPATGSERLREALPASLGEVLRSGDVITGLPLLGAVLPLPAQRSGGERHFALTLVLAVLWASRREFSRPSALVARRACAMCRACAATSRGSRPRLTGTSSRPRRILSPCSSRATAFWPPPWSAIRT